MARFIVVLERARGGPYREDSGLGVGKAMVAREATSGARHSSPMGSIVRTMWLMVRYRIGHVRTGWTWGWSSRWGSGQGGRNWTVERHKWRLVLEGGGVHEYNTLLFVSGSLDINILRLPFFRSGKVPLEDLICRTNRIWDLPTAQIRTPRTTPALSRVTKSLVYASVRKATYTEFNVFVLGRDLVFELGLRFIHYTVSLNSHECE
ncbi:denticleless protein [Dorcoceras hygrometricum]|uniref:Denticleless protein n=1 Tax=Dorcoceras hygrometricum TaxID=472368 RepID=A0A2Z7BHC8_9LAMI|nr:denticleless protein [Dorcoceras hygrometricum]